VTFFWQNPVDSLRGNCSVCALQANAQFYVYEMSRGRLSHELGPYDLDTARQYGRIAASRGSHDRVVTRGRDGPIVKRYAAGSGSPLMANRSSEYRASVQYPGGAVEGPFPVGYDQSFDEVIDLIARDLKPGSKFRIWKPPSRSRRTFRVTAPGVVVEV